MKVRYIYSACVVVETEDVRILSDPWFTQGAEYGSWFHYPPLPEDPVNIIGQVDVIYISHVHTDHYDPLFLRKYLEKYPDTELLICDLEPNLLLRRMISDGFNPTVTQSANWGGTSAYLTANHGYDYECDTAMVVARDELSVANMNDNRIDEDQISAIRAVCPGGRPTLAMLPYAGAGPYPQTYHFGNVGDRKSAEAKKKQQFLDMYSTFCEKLNPVRAMPFAGAYVLGGPLSELNHLRGISDATDVLALPEWGGRSIVLADGGMAEIDLTTLEISATRTEPYAPSDIDRFTGELEFPGYHYEQEFLPIGDKPLPLYRLCKAAYRNAITRHATANEWWICLKSTNRSEFLVLNTSRDNGVQSLVDVEALHNRWEIHLDERLLFLILSGYYHWGNAEGGSHLSCRRIPDVYDEQVHDFLYYLFV